MSIVKLNSPITGADTIFFEEKVATATFTSPAIDFGNGQLGAIEIIAQAGDEGLSVAASQSLKIELLNAVNEVIHDLVDITSTSASATVVPFGGLLGAYVLPTDTDSPVKVKIATAAGGASTGTVDAFANYLP